jgi:hypothetical protein
MRPGTLERYKKLPPERRDAFIRRVLSKRAKGKERRRAEAASNE